MNTIEDLVGALCEALGFDTDAEREATEAAVRRHRVERYEDHAQGSATFDALARAVWDDVTDGAEWVFGDQRPAGSLAEQIAAFLADRLDDPATAPSWVEGDDVQIDVLGEPEPCSDGSAVIGLRVRVGDRVRLVSVEVSEG